MVTRDLGEHYELPQSPPEDYMLFGSLKIDLLPPLLSIFSAHVEVVNGFGGPGTNGSGVKPPLPEYYMLFRHLKIVLILPFCLYLTYKVAKGFRGARTIHAWQGPDY